MADKIVLLEHLNSLATAVKTALNGKANNCRKTIDLTSSTYDINTYYPVISAIPLAGFPRINLYTLFDDCGSPSWSTHANHNFSCNLDILVRAGGYGRTHADTLIRDYSYSHTNNPPHGYQQLDNSSTAVLWLRGGGKYYAETDFSTSWLIKTSEYTVSHQTVEPSATNPGVILTSKSNIYANLNGNAASASAVKDSDNSRTTTIAYSKTGLDSAAWLAAWNDYELRAISPENVRKSMNAFGFIQELGADVNLNDLTEEGYYSQKFSKDALTEDNYPIENAGLLKVFNRCEGIYIYQEYRAYNNSGIWYRTRYQTHTDITWYPWKKVACINDVLVKTNAVTASIPTTGWNSDSTTTYPKYYDITVSDVTEKDRADIIIAPGSIGVAKTCVFCPTSETLAGKIRVRAQSIPTAAIAVQYWIEKGK